MNLNHLQYFRVLAKLEHYTQAAQQLSITQPSLSHAISSLEKDLGVALFEKQGRNIRLTKHGHFFLTYVENALDEIERGEKKLRELTNQIEGSISLGFIPPLASHFIPSLVQSFLERENSNAQFSFGQGSTKQLIQGLKDNQYDLILCSHVESEPTIEFIPILQQDLVLVVSSKHPLSTKESVNLSELISYPFISFKKENELYYPINDLFKQENLIPEIVCEVEDTTAVLGFVSVNYGFSILPTHSFIQQSDIKVIPIDHPKVKYPIYLACKQEQTTSSSMTSFKNYLIEKRHSILLS